MPSNDQNHHQYDNTRDTMSMAGTMPMSMNMNNYMHASFYWGKNATILFPNWPDHSLRMYILALVLVFLAAAAVELLSVPAAVGKASGTVPIIAGYSRTCIYAVRVGLSYMVMLSVMSFNVGVFIAAIAGHAIGFFAVKVTAHKRSKFEEDEEEQTSDLV